MSPGGASDVALQVEAMRHELAPLLAADAAVGAEEAEAALARLDAAVKVCRSCEVLCEGRTNTVFGVGHPAPRLVFIGEAPGFNEDRRGEPFVGDAGQLLNRIIAAIGLTRADVYICNILKCRPPNNRKPLPGEVDACRRYLELQLEILRPDLICCLGGTAANTLLGRAESMSALRGRFYDYRGIPLTATYHPAYLLRTPEAKREVWDDMQKCMRFLAALPEGVTL
jgi:DNA polymerase